MIFVTMTPSPLNPIYIFGQEEPRWWDSNQFSSQRDRANYTKNWPYGLSIFLYVQSSAALELRVCDCATTNTISFYAGVDIGGGLKRFMITAFDPVKVFLMITPVSPPYKINTAPVANTIIAVNSASHKGWQYRFEHSVVTEHVVMEVEIPVALVNPVDVYFYRVNPKNNKDVVLLGQTVENWAGTGIQTKTILFPPVNTSTRIWSKDTILRVIVTPRGGDSFNMRVLNTVAVLGETPYVNRQPSGDFTVEYSAAIVAEVHGLDALYSELYKAYLNNTVNQARITFKNKRQWAQLPANTETQGVIDYAELNHVYPQEMEDIEVAPGEFTRLRNEQKTQLSLETNFLPDYAHRSIKLQMSTDTFKINGIEYIQQEPYTFDPAKHTALSKGQVTLTERKSILKNVI
jgi:hypothetical protein